MRINTSLLLLPFTLLPQLLLAQQVEWLSSTPISWLQFPTAPSSLVSARDAEHVYTTHLTAISYTYNQPMGPCTLSRQGADGATLWTVSIGDTVLLESIASDASGNVVVGGRYFSRLLIDGDPVLMYPSDHITEASFLCCWNADGQLLWQQDVSGGMLDDRSVASIAMDPQGRFWAALSSFFNAEIVRLDASGTQVQTHQFLGSKTIGSVSFDPWGGLYISGAASAPSITVNGAEYQVPHTYAFFVTRLDAAGTSQWLHTAEDITFQRPRVQADETGHACLLGSYFTPLTWGSIGFEQPLWSMGAFLTRVDSLGDFEWGVSTPYTPGSGQLTLANNNSLGVDAEGNSYVLGNVSGELDWGNGVVIGSGTIVNETSALLRFGADGQPVWGLQGGSSGTDAMYDLSVAADGMAHLCGVTDDAFTLGTHTVNAGGGRAAVVARVDPELWMAVDADPITSDGLLAIPTVFASGFRLACAAIPNTASATVLLIDAMGRTVHRATGLEHEFGQGLAPGTYTVLVRAGELSLRTRVVKE